MSKIIHMEVEAVDSTIAVLRTAVQRGRDQEQRLYQMVGTLRFAWQGPAADRFTKEMDVLAKHYSQLMGALEQLTQKLEREKEEWLAADAVFGGDGSSEGAVVATLVGGSAASIGPGTPEWIQHICTGRVDASTCQNIWAHPPRHAGDLAYMIDTLPEDTPIAILNLGNGEVLVLLKGTDPDDPERGNNWGSAVESFFIHKSSYQLSVIDALEEAQVKGLIPPEAKLHIAGHSQGGMVAQNLAVDPRIKQMGLEVETVVTFGSPDTFTKANPNTRYIMFEHASDRVAELDEYWEVAQHIKTLKTRSINDIARSVQVHLRLNDVERVAERHILHVHDSSWAFDHNYSRESVYRELSQYSLSFTEGHTTWSGQDFYASTIQTPIAGGYYLGKTLQYIWTWAGLGPLAWRK